MRLDLAIIDLNDPNGIPCTEKRVQVIDAPMMQAKSGRKKAAKSTTVRWTGTGDRIINGKKQVILMYRTLQRLVEVLNMPPCFPLTKNPLAYGQELAEIESAVEGRDKKVHTFLGVLIFVGISPS